MFPIGDRSRQKCQIFAIRRNSRRCRTPLRSPTEYFTCCTAVVVFVTTTEQCSSLASVVYLYSALVGSSTWERSSALFAVRPWSLEELKFCFTPPSTAPSAPCCPSKAGGFSSGRSRIFLVVTQCCGFDGAGPDWHLTLNFESYASSKSADATRRRRLSLSATKRSLI